MRTNATDLVSVITPTYNASKYVLDTIRSVQAQTYSNWEMLIVDDCSQDNTCEIIKEEMKQDSRIKLKELKTNGGPGHARNTAFNLAKGKYIAFLDSDDLWHPEKLTKQLAFMKEHDSVFSFTAYRIMKESGEKTEVVFRALPTVTYKTLLLNTAIGTLTVVLNKQKLGNFQMKLFRDCSEDYGLWLSILKEGITAHGLNEELAVYRKCENSLSSNKFHSAKKTWNTYRKIENKNVILSCWYLMNYSYHAIRKHAKTI
ncbi:Putative teichuronic acid biosynthesis glycosyltransferase TuaG [Bacillus sp. THAF10]|uniref:glycosyltransferase family 2 protein n=1 Tax=Bacillus sp. THAF10 TaxID=2587848 RepID=UPI001268C7F4|nr:glycosyltransferase family 2 protein [Bacillus sp. THAF10]QFT90334.1 Putative teichuronic acid biosynthesis glycosyltransferase TuaG [Bacillus sp. THAF10]